ncbi:MAG: hypothetical protein GEV09_20010 [Pseudonocardiaceae bacterium]|nr:hypothetical protein [Pseudonocardiaceae bacterium]
MDERELSKLFRDAARHPPPAAFDHDDVLGASRRATVRRRSAFAGGSLLGVAVLGGGLVLGGQLLQPAPPQAGPPPAVATTTAEPGGRMLSPAPLSTMGATPGGRAPAARDAPCGPASAELAAELTGALADRRAAPPGPTVALAQECPPGARAAGVRLPGGTVYLVLSPAAAGVAEGGATRPDGARSFTVTAGGGEMVSVLSVPVARSQPAPLAEQVDDLAREIAAQH